MPSGLREKFFLLFPSFSLVIAGFWDHIFLLPSHPFVPWTFSSVVFFWGLYSPTLLSGLAIFFLGLFMDAIDFFPLGSYGGIHLILYWVALSLRNHLSIASFYWSWGIFSIIFYGMLFCFCFLFSFEEQMHFWNFSVFGTWFATSLTYPFVSYILDRSIQEFGNRAARF